LMHGSWLEMTIFRKTGHHGVEKQKHGDHIRICWKIGC
jgi:hypothetical protein